ncbi:Modulator protein [uncultured Defluviicoccus sp.]|uniref:Modulator protein n=1 Tax=metagenome TaxID=256318 RepID=A0A380TIS3_9ZZZZ|nr:Modulator protein [uncultured Defluviicoccus sp.]
MGLTSIVGLPEEPSAAAALDDLNGLIQRALAAGAEAADAELVHARSLAVSCRLGKQETLERAESTEIGLRVFLGRRQAIVSTSDLSADALGTLVERALAVAACVPEAPFCGLAAPHEVAGDVVDVDAFCPAEPTVESLSAKALACEAAALDVVGVTNAEGAEASWGMDVILLAGSNGMARAHRRSRHGLSVSVLAGAGTAMERDYDSAAAVYEDDLPAAAALGRTAGERAVRRLHPRKATTAKVPVVYEQRAARSLLGHLAMAINGSAVARGTTFLKDRLGELIFSPEITITDDPLRRRGLRSRPFDAEGLAAQPMDLVDQGRLTAWLLDLRSARQLGLASNGRATRGPSSPPSPSASNLYLAAGAVTPQELMADIREGLLVSELIGFGVNGVTGDYSRGASGYWIVNGEPAYPVSEVTVSGNLIDMFARLSAASDLTFRYGIDAPTVRIDGMTVAGR